MVISLVKKGKAEQNLRFARRELFRIPREKERADNYPASVSTVFTTRFPRASASKKDTRSLDLSIRAPG